MIQNRSLNFQLRTKQKTNQRHISKVQQIFSTMTFSQHYHHQLSVSFCPQQFAMTNLKIILTTKQRKEIP